MLLFVLCYGADESFVFHSEFHIVIFNLNPFSWLQKLDKLARKVFSLYDTFFLVNVCLSIAIVFYKWCAHLLVGASLQPWSIVGSSTVRWYYNHEEEKNIGYNAILIFRWLMFSYIILPLEQLSHEYRH